MKKNFAMRIAACLLVVTMLSLCMVSHTYAKYTTQNNNVDTARVAKWGVKVEAASNDLFSKVYNNADNEVTVNAKELVVAPGTEGTLTMLTVSGTPEVATRVYATAELTLTGWELENGTFYCPLIITVGTATLEGTTYASAADFAAAVKTAVEATLNAEHIAGATLNDSIEVSWAWEFDGNDANDTYFGNLAANGNAPKISLNVIVTVDQINDLK